MSVLSAQSLSKGFGQGPVLDRVSLELRPGSFTCLVGRSGCGKTTLLRLLAGLERADSGRIAMAGGDVVTPGPDRAVVFQGDALLPWLTASGNVALAVRSRHPDWTWARVLDEAWRRLEAV